MHGRVARSNNHVHKIVLFNLAQFVIYVGDIYVYDPGKNASSFNGLIFPLNLLIWPQNKIPLLLLLWPSVNSVTGID